MIRGDNAVFEILRKARLGDATLTTSDDLARAEVQRAKPDVTLMRGISRDARSSAVSQNLVLGDATLQPSDDIA